jgi:hypothetical protein
MRHTGNRIGSSNLPLSAIYPNQKNNLAASTFAAGLNCELLFLAESVTATIAALII